MWNGKKKAITFSYDDGISQDIRLVELFNKYGLKATFNINSELLGKPGKLIRNGVEVRHDKIAPERVATIYAGHEVAAHTLTHPFLPRTADAEVIRQVEEDRKNLSALCGYEVVGMAYPGGGPGGNHDARVEKLIRENTGIKYARGVGLTFQIIDDILDVEGDAALLGKATHADAALEKTTFLSFMSIDEAKDYAKKLTEEAIAAIAPFDGNEALTELAKFLLTRKK